MPDATPFVSIIIPTYNRPRQLVGCLEALKHLDYPSDCFEVIVVDDGSQTPVTTSALSGVDRLNLTIVRQPNHGPAAARNHGVEQARGELIAFTDDDCRPTPNWLRGLIARFIQTPNCLVGGRTVNALTDNPYSTASQLLVSYLYAYYNTNHDRATFFASNNLAVAASAFRAIGGFDHAYLRAAAEDRELCDRWLHAGHRLVYAPEAVVYHAHDLSLTSFWRQHFTYGRGAYAFHQARARRGLGRVRVEPLPFYLNLLRYPLTNRTGGAPSGAPPVSLTSAVRLACLLTLSQVAGAVGYAWERLRHAYILS